MANEDAGGQERTEQPTPKRRAQAHDEGRVARSTELSTAFVLLAGVVMLSTVGVAGFHRLALRLLHETSHALGSADLSPSALLGILAGTVRGYLGAFAVFAGGVFAIVVAVNAMQARGVLSLTPITPKFSYVNPAAGLKRIASLNSLFTGLKALAKLAAIGLVTWLVLGRMLPVVLNLTETGPEAVVGVIDHMAVRLVLTLVGAYLVIAIGDFAWQRHQLEKSLRMTRQEVVYEHRDSEGNPHVKGRMLSLSRTLARQRMLQGVPTADVVVVNPTRIAVALKYDVDVAAAPIVVAMGQRKLARRIREIAGRAGVPIVENRPVARALLATGKVGRPIPPALYAAVAEILAWVYRRTGRLLGAPVPVAEGRTA